MRAIALVATLLLLQAGLPSQIPSESSNAKGSDASLDRLIGALESFVLDEISAKIVETGISVRGKSADELPPNLGYLTPWLSSSSPTTSPCIQLASWSSGRMSGIGLDRLFVASPSTERLEAHYWDGQRHLIVKLLNNIAVSHGRFRSPLFRLWPQFCLGVHGATPHVAWIKHARAAGTLVVKQSDGVIDLEYPSPFVGTRAKSSSRAVCRMRCEMTPRPRIRSVVLVGESGDPVHDYRVDQWSVRPHLPSQVTIKKHVATLGVTIVETFEVDWYEGPVFDGAAVVGFAHDAGALKANGRVFVMRDAVDRVLADEVLAVGASMPADAQKRFPGTSTPPEDTDLARRARAKLQARPEALADPRWPRVLDAEKTFRSADWIDIESQHCVQTSLAFLAKLLGKPARFEEILEYAPDPIVTADKISSIGRAAGFDFTPLVVRDGSVGATELRRPFLFVSGNHGSTLHLGVAIPHAEGVSAWSPPNRHLVIPAGGRLRGANLVFVASDEVHRLRRSTVWPTALVILLSGSAALAIVSVVRRRQRTALSGAATCLFVMSVLGCSSRVVTPIVVELDTVHIDGLKLRERVPASIPIQNNTDRTVTLRGKVSCSCISLPKRSIVLPPRSRSQISVIVEGTSHGTKNARIRFASDLREMPVVTVDFVVEVTSALYIDPSRVELRGEPETTISSAFSVGRRRGVSGTLRCSVDRRQLSNSDKFKLVLNRDTRRGPAESELFDVSLRIGTVAPGVYCLPVVLSLDDSNVKPATAQVTVIVASR